MKEQTSLKRVAQDVMRSMNAQFEFNAGDIKMGNESCMDWKIAWKNLKNIISEGNIRNKLKVPAKRDYIE